MEDYLEKAKRFESQTAMPDRIQALALIAIAEELRVLKLSLIDIHGEMQAIRKLLEWKFLPINTVVSQGEKDNEHL